MKHSINEMSIVPIIPTPRQNNCTKKEIVMLCTDAIISSGDKDWAFLPTH